MPFVYSNDPQIEAAAERFAKDPTWAWAVSPQIKGWVPGATSLRPVSAPHEQESSSESDLAQNDR